MSFKDYLRSRIIYFVAPISLATAFIIYLWLVYPAEWKVLGGVVLISSSLGILIPLALDYRRKKLFHKRLHVLSSGMDPTEVKELPSNPEEQLIERLLLEAIHHRDAEVNHLSQANDGYREYIESWVHQIKAPLALLSLVRENYEKQLPKNGLRSLESAYQTASEYVEEVLYYARSQTIESDTILEPIPILETVKSVIRKKAPQLVETRASVRLEGGEHIVLADGKWMEYVLRQILDNAMKYAGEWRAQILITTSQEGDRIFLSIQDQGVGIPKEELPFVFNKSFTGTNGHSQTASTGMGLYIVKRLCDKMGIGLVIESEHGTKVTLDFPIC